MGQVFITRRGGGKTFIYEETLSTVSKDYVVPLNINKYYKIYCFIGSGYNYGYWEYALTDGVLSKVSEHGNSVNSYFKPTIDSVGNLTPFYENGTPDLTKLLIVGV